MIYQILLIDLLDAKTSMQIFCMTYLAILFLQSGLDKVFNYKGNYEWLKGHFAKSPLKNMVSIMIPMITVLEVLTGILSAIGLVLFLLTGDTQIGLYGAQLSAISILALFFGQRLAQDYAGAASLGAYFLICMLGIYMLGLG